MCRFRIESFTMCEIPTMELARLYSVDFAQDHPEGVFFRIFQFILHSRFQIHYDQIQHFSVDRIFGGG